MPPTRAARHRCLLDPDTGEPLDDALVLWFPAPASFTGEDMAELHLHGSRAVLAAVMAALGRIGLRLAEPGEFTRRAFENGKLDLTQAEAVADLAAAEPEAQRRQALRQLDGALGSLYHDWSRRLTRALAHLEAAIDFPDEDLPPGLDEQIVAETGALAAEIGRHLADGHRGERLRDGIGVAIVGPPNAGKSSLLNRIARREAAITSPLPGTTRDIVEVAIDLAGYPVLLADTAGLRDSPEPIEQEGLRRAHARADEAELRLFVFDARRPADAAGAAQWAGPDTILVANKTDLLAQDCRHPNPPPQAGEGSHAQGTCQRLGNSPSLAGGEGRGSGRCTTVAAPSSAIPISALTGEGLDTLLAALAARLAATYRTEAPLLTRARHRQALEAAAGALARSLAAPLPELRAEDLRMGLRHLGTITGTVDVEHLLDLIFRDFCIGK